MSEDNKYGLQDLVLATAEQKPVEFEAAFNDLVVDRIRDAIENKKVEIAQQMYGYDPEPEPEYEEENDDEFGGSELEDSEETYSEEE